MKICRYAGYADDADSDIYRQIHTEDTNDEDEDTSDNFRFF